LFNISFIVLYVIDVKHYFSWSGGGGCLIMCI